MGPRDRSGKAVERPSSSSNRNDWTWDGRGYWWKTRVSSKGESKYEYRYPEGAQPSNQQQIPRSPGPNIFEAKDTYTSPPGSPSGPSYVPGGAPGPAYGTISEHTPEDTSAYATAGFYDNPPSSFNTQGWSRNTSEEANYMQRPESSGSNTSTVRYSANAFGTSVAMTPYSSTSQPYYTPVGAVSDTLSGDFQGLSVNPSHNASYQAYASPSSQPNLFYSSTTPNNLGELNKRYSAVSTEYEKDFWQVGRVFKALWTEPARQGLTSGGSSTSTQASNTQLSTTYLSGQAYTEIRHFVVVGEGWGSSICSPIHTYGGQATLKPNLPERQQHAIIYTSDKPPGDFYYKDILESLTKDPIKVIRHDLGPDGDLGVTSRLNYSKVYTVEHYVKVLNIGMVDGISLPSLEKNCRVKKREGKPEGPDRHRSHYSSSKNDRRGKGKEREIDSRYKRSNRH